MVVEARIVAENGELSFNAAELPEKSRAHAGELNKAVDALGEDDVVHEALELGEVGIVVKQLVDGGSSGGVGEAGYLEGIVGCTSNDGEGARTPGQEGDIEAENEVHDGIGESECGQGQVGVKENCELRGICD
jgi:hypothetical protein